MLVRRLYSSLPSTRAGGSSHTISSLPTKSKSKPQTRGRIKPRLNGSSLCKSKSARSVSSSSISRSGAIEGNGKGRKYRRSSLSNSRNEINLVSDSNRYSIERISVFDEQDNVYENIGEEDYSNSSIAPITKSTNLNKSPRLLFTHPVPSSDQLNSNAFKPIYLYPEQFKLHYTFNSPNYPLPLNLGTTIYTTPRKVQSKEIMEKNINDLFNIPNEPNPVKSLSSLPRKLNEWNGLNDHFKVINNLKHPELLKYLGNNGYNPWESMNVDTENSNLNNQLTSKLNELKENNDQNWENVLSKLEGKSTSKTDKVEVEVAPKVEQKDDNLDEVVNGLNNVLAKLGLSSTSTTTRGRKNLSMVGIEDIGLLGEDGVLLDSVKRKRKKKISKHKYKKRRKATRALRKRLGK